MDQKIKLASLVSSLGVIAVLASACNHPPVSTDATYLSERRQSEQYANSAARNWTGNRDLYVSQVDSRVQDFDDQVTSFRREANHRSGEEQKNLRKLADNLDGLIKNLNADLMDLNGVKDRDQYASKRQVTDKQLAQAESIDNAGTAIASQR